MFGKYSYLFSSKIQEDFYLQNQSKQYPEQGSANFPFKRPDSKYWGLPGSQGLSQLLSWAPKAADSMERGGGPDLPLWFVLHIQSRRENLGSGKFI